MEAEQLHPQARTVLDRQERFGMVPLHEHGVRRMRWFSKLAAWFRNRSAPSVARTFDRTVPGPAGDLPVRVYRPYGTGPFPTLVYFHGGGFVSGGLDTHDALCRHLTIESGAVVVSVDYRLAPEHPFPAAVEDAIAATEWAADEREFLAGDGRLVVAGDSAGGTLAAVVALDAADRADLGVDRQLLVYPGIGIEEDQASVRDHGGLVLTREDLEWFRDCYYDSELHLHNPYADPAEACDLAGVAPATVLTAGFDPLRDGGVAYAERLESAGVETRHVHYDDMIHGFLTMTDAIDRATDAIADVAGDV